MPKKEDPEEEEPSEEEKVEEVTPKRRITTEEILDVLGLTEDIGVFERITALRRAKGDSLSDAITIFLLLKYMTDKKDREWAQILEEKINQVRKETLSFKEEIKPLINKTLEMMDRITQMLSIATGSISQVAPAQMKTYKVEVID
jgi:hypothetical protein